MKPLKQCPTDRNYLGCPDCPNYLWTWYEILLTGRSEVCSNCFKSYNLKNNRYQHAFYRLVHAGKKS
jgi:hypothetical protein